MSEQLPRIVAKKRTSVVALLLIGVGAPVGGKVIGRFMGEQAAKPHHPDIRSASVTSPFAPSYNPPSGWAEFSSQDGAISAWFPTKPIEKTVAVQKPEVDYPINLTLLAAVTSRRGYAVSYYRLPEGVELPSEDDATALDRTVNGILAEMNATLTSQRNISLNGYPGRHFTASTWAQEKTPVLIHANVFFGSPPS